MGGGCSPEVCFADSTPDLGTPLYAYTISTPNFCVEGCLTTAYMIPKNINTASMTYQKASGNVGGGCSVALI